MSSDYSSSSSSSKGVSDVLGKPQQDGFEVAWKRVGKVEVLLPKGVEFPLGVVHFIGGQAVGAVPRATYGPFLEGVARAGFVVLATPIRINEFNHQELACDVAREFRLCYRDVEALYGRAALRRAPVFGIGHSMGAKLQVLINCFPDVRDVARRRKANVLISFNNFAARDSVPLLAEMRALGLRLGGLSEGVKAVRETVASLGLGGLSPMAERGLNLAVEWGAGLGGVPDEFKPAPDELWQLLEGEYAVRNNLVVQFKSDTLDQSGRLSRMIFDRFGRDGALQYSTLQGSHVTPNTPDLSEVDLDEWLTAAAGGGPAAARAAGVASSGVRASASVAAAELDELIRTVVIYLKSQALWGPDGESDYLLQAGEL